MCLLIHNDADCVVSRPAAIKTSSNRAAAVQLVDFVRRGGSGSST